MVELINEDFADEAIQKRVEDRLMPRTEELPIYNMQEFNDKVMVMVMVYVRPFLPFRAVLHSVRRLGRLPIFWLVLSFVLRLRHAASLDSNKRHHHKKSATSSF